MHFSNLPVMFFPKFVYMTKNTPFFSILHVFAPLNDVRAYSAWSWKTTLITWIFGRAWYPPLTFEWPPQGRGLVTNKLCMLNRVCPYDNCCVPGYVIMWYPLLLTDEDKRWALYGLANTLNRNHETFTVCSLININISNTVTI